MEFRLRGGREFYGIFQFRFFQLAAQIGLLKKGGGAKSRKISSTNMCKMYFVCRSLTVNALVCDQSDIIYYQIFNGGLSCLEK